MVKWSQFPSCRQTALDRRVRRNCSARYNAVRMALASGTKLGPYEIQSPLGAGGVGEVYRARDTRLDRTVAIKVLAG
jgi:serine/threonine protein kinase